VLTRAIRLGIVLSLVAGCGPDEFDSPPPALQGLAIGETGPNRFRLAVMASGDGVLQSHWQVTKGVLDTPDQLQTELTLPGQPGAYPVRLTVQDASGGAAQALFVILHDPNGRTELAPATVATFKREELRTAQTQVIALQRGAADSPPQPVAPQAGLRLAGVDIANDSSAVSLDAKLQVTSVAGDTMATWSALSGSFDTATGLKAKWRPASASGLEAVTLSVTNGLGQQSQAVVRLLVEQGVPRDNWLDFVQVQNGRLVRQTFAAIPSPTTGAASLPSVLSLSAPDTSPMSAASPSPLGSPTASGSPSASPTPSPSPSPSPSGSPTASTSPQASSTPEPYVTMPPSGGPTTTPKPGASSSAAPNSSATPYNPLATPTPQKSPSPSPSH
jgi:hypothetical protein